MVFEIDLNEDTQLDRLMTVFLFGFIGALFLRFVESAYKTTLLQ